MQRIHVRLLPSSPAPESLGRSTVVESALPNPPFIVSELRKRFPHDPQAWFETVLQLAATVEPSMKNFAHSLVP